MTNEISLCMIVKNEEKCLPKCLESVQDIVNEIIIVDTGSTDKTVEIAKGYGAKVYYYEWNNNFSAARNESLKYATKDWILIMDGDDEFCNECKSDFRSLVQNQLDENAIYFFQTLNYYGDMIDSNCITINLNPRLFKNNKGIHYEGEVHNQLVSVKNEYNGICDTIKIKHYGYLSENIKSKKKRERNIAILGEQIDKNPENKFAFFNLGNEYTALGDTKKALEYYYKAYEDFRADTGYSAILLLRIIISNYNIEEYDTALNFIDVALKYYPNFTDVYFFKALIYKEKKHSILQVKNLEKCIELGEAPPELSFILGSGSFKAYYELGEAYLSFRDYDTAFQYYLEAIKSNHEFIQCYYCIAYILEEKRTPIDELKVTIEGFFHNYPKEYSIIADIFYYIGYYQVALEYIKKLEEANEISEDNNILKAKCLIRTGAFKECFDVNLVSFPMYKILCCILDNKYEDAIEVIKNVKDEYSSDYDKKQIKIYIQLINLLNKQPTEVICQEEDEEYYKIILEICEIMLINNKYNQLEIAVYLFNLINSKLALLYLGKLYYRWGYLELARKEIIRSIEELNVIDMQGLDILKKILISPN